MTGCSVRGKDHYWDIQMSQLSIHQRPHQSPVQSSVTTTQGGKRNRGDPPLAILLDKYIESMLNILNPCRRAPVILGREIDNGMTEQILVKIGDSRFHLLAIATGFVIFEHLWESLLELQSDPLTHNPYTINGVNQGLGLAFK